MKFGHQVTLNESRRCAVAGAALTVAVSALAGLVDPLLAAVTAVGGTAATIAAVRLELTRR